MSGPLAKLSNLRVQKLLKHPGMYGDGGGLWLCVTSKSASSWIFRYQSNGRQREMGLGSTRAISIADARALATQARRARALGLDPIAERDRKAAEERLEAAKAITFEQCAKTYIEAHRAGWRNAKHVAQWSRSLETYAYPLLGSLPIASVDVGLVHRVLEPIWTGKPETASRIRGRIESILDWAATRGYRRGDNPARWRGHLENLFPKRSKLRRVKHHAALPYAELPTFMTALTKQPGEGARALRFSILTAARTGEVIGAQASEVSHNEAIWSIPPERMKAGRIHRVPLSDAALALLAVDRQTGWLFQAPGDARPLSNMAMLATLRRMGRTDLTTHGFRSSFRDWCAEQTSYAGEIAEAALAHVVGDKVEAAYRRGDLFEKRRTLMQEWADFCMGRSAIAARSRQPVIDLARNLDIEAAE